MRINNDVYNQKHISDLCTNSDALASTSERLQEPETIPLHRHYSLHYHAQTIKGDESDKYLGHRHKASRITAYHHYRFRVSSMKIRAPAILGISIIPAALSQSPAYGQCGGINWTGPTTCVSGYTCQYSNDWYSQCVPGVATTAVSSSTTTRTFWFF
ncbi:hypothetical protein FRB91_001134 [Serendipita sp. 411]|nr:hypothetical protein FRB91_001134 [Serendipita sp. 411]